MFLSNFSAHERGLKLGHGQHRELGDAFEYVVLEPHATFKLSDALTKEYSVHSGWLRVHGHGHKHSVGFRPRLPSNPNR